MTIKAIYSFLQYAKDNNHLIEVNEDSNYIGFVSNFSDETLEMKLMDYYNNDIGIANIEVNYINIIKCQNIYLKDLELLLQNDKT